MERADASVSLRIGRRALKTSACWSACGRPRSGARSPPEPELRWTPARPNAGGCLLGWALAGSHRRVSRARVQDHAIRPLLCPRVVSGALALSQVRIQSRAQQMCAECKYLVELHAVRRVILLFHGPSAAGRIEAACADYRRKLPGRPSRSSAPDRRPTQSIFSARRREWASEAGVLLYRCEVDAAGGLTFVNLDPDATFGSDKRIRDPRQVV